MDGNNYCVIDSVGGYENFEQLVKRGRQLHGEAVFEVFARLFSSPVLFLRNIRSTLTRKRDRSLELYIKQQNPA